MKDLSIIIKTFIRLNCLERLLDSLIEKYSDIPILILDDSLQADSNKKTILKKYKKLKIKYITCEYDVGLSYGRNVLLENVKTKYFLLCDDDFIFNDKTNLEYAIEKVKSLNADIYAGVCKHAFRVNYEERQERIQLMLRGVQKLFNRYREISYIGTIECKDNEIVIVNNPIRYNVPRIYKTDICENFFIGDTEKIKQVKWNDKLKISEHEDFFIRAKAHNLRIYLDTNFQIYHFPETNASFQIKRSRDDFWKILLEVSNIKSLIIYRNNVGTKEKFTLDGDRILYEKKESFSIKSLIKVIGNKICRK